MFTIEVFAVQERQGWRGGGEKKQQSYQRLCFLLKATANARESKRGSEEERRSRILRHSSSSLHSPAMLIELPIRETERKEEEVREVVGLSWDNDDEG
eukprot:761703-Hanusia_phi.AAC.1